MFNEMAGKNRLVVVIHFSILMILPRSCQDHHKGYLHESQLSYNPD